MNKIILVDDDEFVLEQLAEIIEWSDYDFELAGTFTDGNDALAFVSSMPVNAVITDIKMNNMSGLELAQILNRDFPDIKIAVMSAYRDFEYARKALTCGVTNYILKPIVFNDFVECIQQLSASLSKVNNTVAENSDRDPILVAISYMNEHLSEKIALSAIAHQLGFNTNYFSDYFKRNTGENFVTFLTKLRVSKAKQLLKNTDIKVSVICDMVGYKNHTHFYNVFAEYSNGLTPTQYRENEKQL